MVSNGIGPQFRPRSGKLANSPLIPEIEVYLHLLVLIHLIDLKKLEKVSRIDCYWCNNFVQPCKLLFSLINISDVKC